MSDRTPSLYALLRIALLLVFAIAAVLLFGCEKIDRNMWDNPAFKPQEDPVRLPPKDSIPTKGREQIPSMAEARELKNPVEPTEWALLQGKELFGIHCVPCHGISGAGDGPVGKKYVPTPADLRPGSRGARHSDGELFAVISSGYGGMPAYRADLSPSERWHIVAYLRTLK
ncbi:MAG: cytochrome c [Deltaproteobacteria bacterium]|nr:cytochrome c [Deltaproteobacteria bacterium]